MKKEERRKKYILINAQNTLSLENLIKPMPLGGLCSVSSLNVLFKLKTALRPHRKQTKNITNKNKTQKIP